LDLCSELLITRICNKSWVTQSVYLIWLITQICNVRKHFQQKNWFDSVLSVLCILKSCLVSNKTHVHHQEPIACHPVEVAGSEELKMALGSEPWASGLVKIIGSHLALCVLGWATTCIQLYDQSWISWRHVVVSREL